MRILATILVLLCCFRAASVDLVTATLTVTGGTTNGQTLTVNGDVRTWTNSVVIPTTQILTNSTANGAKTNLTQHLGLSRLASIQVQDNGAASLKLVGASGLTMTVTPSAGWATVTYSTQTVSAAVAVRIPTSIEVAAQQTNINSGLLAAIRATSDTNVFYESDPQVVNLVGKTNAQTITGNKAFTASSNYFSGGYFRNPTTTNLTNYGSAISSPGNGVSSEQFGAGATATGQYTLAVGPGATANGLIAIAIGNNASAVPASGDAALAIGLNASAAEDSTTAVGSEAMATAVGSTSLGYLAEALATNGTAIGKNALVGNGKYNSTAIGYNANSSRTNQVTLGTSTSEVYVPGNLQVDGYTTNLHTFGTNTFPAGADVSFGRYALSSLANGINQDIVVGTNVFVEVSGPSSAFSIEGIAGGRDGKFLIIYNGTGQNMTIACEGGATGNDPTAANRILTYTGADIATTGNGSALLIYNANSSRWILLNLAQ